MRWCWLVVLAACGTDPTTPDPFPGGTAIATDPHVIFEVAGDGTSIVWITLGVVGAPASLWRLRDGETEPRKLYTVPGGEQPGGLVLVNHQPYFEVFVGEAFPSIVTVDDAGTVSQLGDGSQSLAGGDGSFLIRSRQGVVTIADPRTGPERDPWEMTFTSDNGTYVYGSGKIVHSFYSGGSGETIQLGTGKREAFSYPHHTPLALVPADNGFFFYETGVGLFRATSDGTSQLSRDPGFASWVALGDDLWLAFTGPARELEPTVTGLARIRPDGSADVRELQADSAMVFRYGSRLMAVTHSSNDVDFGSTIWRVDN